MLLGSDDLVHICAYGSLQRGTSCLTALHYSLVLGLCLTLNQTVHGIRDLITHKDHYSWKLARHCKTIRSNSAANFTSLFNYQRPVPLPFLHLSLQAWTDLVSQLRKQLLHHQVSQDLGGEDKKQRRNYLNKVS